MYRFVFVGSCACESVQVLYGVFLRASWHVVHSSSARAHPDCVIDIHNWDR